MVEGICLAHLRGYLVIELVPLGLALGEGDVVACLEAPDVHSQTNQLVLGVHTQRLTSGLVKSSEVKIGNYFAISI